VSAVRPNAENRGKGQVGSIGTGLIPTLDGGTNGASDDGQVQRQRLAPFVEDLVSEVCHLLLVQGELAGDVLVVNGVLGDEGAFLEKRQVLTEALFGRKCLDIAEENVAWDPGKRVPNSRRVG
jgi:hypothetical protein